MGDKRKILLFNGIFYSVDELVQDYNKYYDDISPIKDDFDKLYKFFGIDPKDKLGHCLSEITSEISKRLDILVNSVPNKDLFYIEIKRARRRFIYWGDVDYHVYGIIEGVHFTKSNLRLKDKVPRDKSFYDNIIYCICILLILNNCDIKSCIEDDKLWKHKADYEYVEALKELSSKYNVDENLEINLEKVFGDIYKTIATFDSISVFNCFIQFLSNYFDNAEKRIVVNNELNNEIPVMWHLVLKSLTKAESESDKHLGQKEYQEILMKLKNAIVLMDSDNEHDLSFLLPNQAYDYLERLMRYSAIYDLHQYDVDGMLFLLKRIIAKYPDEIKGYFDDSAESVYDTISEMIGIIQKQFIEKGSCILSAGNLSKHQRCILDKMVVTGALNTNYYSPIQWNNVDDDSEFVVKKGNEYFFFPPVISALGVYDRIGRALSWRDFGTEVEKSVKDLFSNIDGLKVYSGKYTFEKDVFEADAIVLGTEYALLIECKRKGLSRKARGGDRKSSIKDLAETYFSSQKQAYHTYRAIIDNSGLLELYPSECNISVKSVEDGDFEEQKTVVDFSTVKNIIRVSCTGGNFWIAAEGGITDNIEMNIEKFDTEGNDYIQAFINERDYALKCTSKIGKKVKPVKLNRMFISFDKLYSIVSNALKANKSGDSLLEQFWKLTRMQSKKGDTLNHLSFFTNLSYTSGKHNN